jgi:hypothetical protein
VIVGHGPKGSRPAGRLPVFSTDTKEEAEALLVLACEKNMGGEYIARELAHEQTLENLQAFSDRLDGIYTKYLKRGPS